MSSKSSSFFKGSIFITTFLLFGPFIQAQLLEIDYTKDKREENTFKAQFIRTGIIGASSLKNLDLTVEALKLTLNNKQKSQFAFTLYGTNTVWRGNRIDELNTFDFLMNPIGGRINGSFFTGASGNKTLGIMFQSWICLRQ